MSDDAEVESKPVVPEVARAEGAEDDPRIDITETDPVEPKASVTEAPAAEAEGEAAPAEPPAPLRRLSSLPPRAWPPKTVADIMTRKVITLLDTEPVGDLEEWMTRFRFHHLPVVSEEGKLVGLITRTDLLHAMLGRGPDGKPIEHAQSQTPAGAIMNKNVVTAHPDAAINTACRVMLNERLSCLPVLADDGTLVGILTDTDYVRLAAEVLDRYAAG